MDPCYSRFEVLSVVLMVMHDWVESQRVLIMLNEIACFEIRLMLYYLVTCLHRSSLIKIYALTRNIAWYMLYGSLILL